MHRVIQIAVDDTVPSLRAVLKAQGIPASADPGERIRSLAKESIEVYAKLARPIGLLKEISLSDFKPVFEGQGCNEPETPLGPIFPKADRMALFAVTLGERVGAEITQLFDRNDFATGAMLDAAASEGTELAADVLEREYTAMLKQEVRLNARTGQLRFSPGYCGWHVGAQKRLFAYLEPDHIGIGLTESCVMHPLKSISGVIVVGNKSIFDFEQNFPFCGNRCTQDCRERLDQVKEQSF